MSDVKDILGVPKKSQGGDSSGKAKGEEKKKADRPKWMSREAYALLDNAHPIPPSVLAPGTGPAGLKGKPKTSARGKITWQWMPFTNTARTDDLRLSHWVKCYKDISGRIRPADDREYPFTKFNKKPALITYSDEEFNSLLAAVDTRWSRAETDHLMDLCAQFDLRFNVIADRYNFKDGASRTMEDLKARYYSLARVLLISREGEDAVSNLEIVRHPYNFAHEMDRKRRLALAWAQSTGLENPEDARVLEEAAAIEARNEAGSGSGAQVIDRNKRNAAASAAAAVVRPEPPAEEGVPSLFSPQGIAIKPKPGAYARGAHAREIANTQVAGLIGGSRAQKIVDVTLAELGIKGPPVVPTRQVCGAWLALRAEVIQVLELKKRLQTKQGNSGDFDKRQKRRAPARYDDGTNRPEKRRK